MASWSSWGQGIQGNRKWKISEPSRMKYCCCDQFSSLKKNKNMRRTSCRYIVETNLSKNLAASFQRRCHLERAEKRMQLSHFPASFFVSFLLDSPRAARSFFCLCFGSGQVAAEEELSAFGLFLCRSCRHTRATFTWKTRRHTAGRPTSHWFAFVYMYVKQPWYPIPEEIKLPGEKHTGRKLTSKMAKAEKSSPHPTVAQSIHAKTFSWNTNY